MGEHVYITMKWISFLQHFLPPLGRLDLGHIIKLGEVLLVPTASTLLNSSQIPLGMLPGYSVSSQCSKERDKYDLIIF